MHGTSADRGLGNVVALQPVFANWDYRGPVEFMAAVQPSVETALASDWLRPETVVVFPERAGLYLSLAEEWPGVYAARSLTAAAFRALAPSPARWPGWLRRSLRSGATDSAAQELLWSKSGRSSQLADDLFGGLAARYRLAVVGGSCIAVQGGSARVEGRAYGPDGSILATFGKERLDAFDAHVLGAAPGAQGIFEHAGQTFTVVLGTDSPAGRGVALNPTAGVSSGGDSVPCRLRGRLWGQTYAAGRDEPTVRNVWL